MYAWNYRRTLLKRGVRPYSVGVRPCFQKQLLSFVFYFLFLFFLFIINLLLNIYEAYNESYFSNSRNLWISQGVDEINLMIKLSCLFIIYCIFINSMISLTTQTSKILGFRERLMK